MNPGTSAPKVQNIQAELHIASTNAAAQLETYQPPISANFEIPIHIGRLIAQWDKPEFVGSGEAHFMRGDDYVAGVLHKGAAIAFPLWITDYYHVINCVIANDPVTFTTCERCQSGSAFIRSIAGREVKFSAMGMYNASLTMTDRSNILQRSGSIWLHYEGACVYGPHKGLFLEQIPTYHMTWSEWLALHPESSIMAMPEDPRHQDGRHGHGREEIFSRPGMDPPLIQTITGDLDGRYPENEMVLGLNLDVGVKCWPLREVQQAGGVVNDYLDSLSLVVFSGPSPEQITMAAYARQLEGQLLTFDRSGDCYIDRETGTSWNIEGRAITGPMEGKQLSHLRWQYVRWHAWFYPHRSTDQFSHEGAMPKWPKVAHDWDARVFAETLDQLVPLGYEVSVERVIPHLSRPHECDAAITIRVGNDRLNLYRFASSEAAYDYVELQGAYFCHPISLKLARKFSIRLGALVLESDPERQYEGPSQFIRLPDPEIRWSALVTKAEGVAPLDSLLPQNEELQDGNTFTGLFLHLKKHGFDIVETSFLPHSQLRPGVRNAVAVTINADRFALYRCDNRESAISLEKELPHALQASRWVIRSTPAIMFQDPCYEMGQLCDEATLWSPLLEQPRFIDALRKFLPEI